MIEFSKVSQAVKPSLTRHLFNLARQYDDVIDFTLGDPDIPPHQAIKDAACKAIQESNIRYSQNAGLLSLRETICNYYQRKENLVFDPLSEVIVTVGAMEGLYLSLLSLLNPGDEVIIPAPYYVNYVQMVHLCSGTPIVVDNPDIDNLSFRIEDVERAISKRTKIIMINTPSNPSGQLISDDKIQALAKIAKKYNLIVIADEVYKSLIYDGGSFRSIVTIDGMRERTILINSLSKEFCMTGWRVGYVIAPSEIVATMVKLQENVVACAPVPSQYAAIEALSGKDDYSADMVSTFTSRRNVLVDGIKSIPGLSCTIPQATFYLMVDISKTGMTSEQFAIDLLQNAHVAVVPGIAYGISCDKYVRIAFTLSEEKIKIGVERIRKYMQKIAI